MRKVLPQVKIPDPVEQFMEAAPSEHKLVSRRARGFSAQQALEQGPPRPAPEDARFLCVCGCHPALHDDWGCKDTCACVGYRPSEVLFESSRWPVLGQACRACSGTGYERYFRCVYCKTYVEVDGCVQRDNNPEGFWCEKCTRPAKAKPSGLPTS